VKVVFMRTSFVASAIGAEIFEVTDGQLKFVGALPKGTKIVYETTPGQKVFMAYGTAADFMLGNLAGGKIYYSIVRPNWGTGGMIPTPVKTNANDREFSMQSPEFSQVFPGAKNRLRSSSDPAKYYEYLIARDELITHVLKVMADNKLDAIVHKSIEHQPTLIRDGINPPHVNHRGAPHLNTFLLFVPTIAVPAGFTRDNLPAGISFLGRPYDDGNMIKLAYAYEQATHHRRPPASTN